MSFKEHGTKLRAALSSPASLLVLLYSFFENVLWNYIMLFCDVLACIQYSIFFKSKNGITELDSPVMTRIMLTHSYNLSPSLEEMIFLLFRRIRQYTIKS